jgi:PPK2 family polyphosphate:nucleotide phosphotransferase
MNRRGSGVKESSISGRAAAEGRGERRRAPAIDAVFDGIVKLKKGSLEAELIAPKGKSGRVELDAIPTDYTFGLSEKKALKKLRKDQLKLDALQYKLYADGRHRVLIVLQALDTGGKDGTIRHVMRTMNPQGVTVHRFQKPTEEEKRHHYLWRVRNAVPGPGMIGIFNRSHYEDILVPTVYQALPAPEIEARYAELNAFEKELADHGTLILKFYLHISRAEQKRRLQERLDDPDKNWKFSPEDLKTRALWDDFYATYEKILARTNTPWAPWFVIPADEKWFRDYAIGHILRRAMKRLDLRFPPPPPNLDKITIPD